jgi:hypothetical protein
MLVPAVLRWSSDRLLSGLMAQTLPGAGQFHPATIDSCHQTARPQVPVSTTSLVATSTMRAAWMRDAAADPWTTTSASAAQAAALAAPAGRLQAARPGY